MTMDDACMILVATYNDVKADGGASPDANPLTNRFGLISVPDSVTPWAYTPEAWEPRPPIDLELLDKIWPYIDGEGTDNLDMGAASDSAYASAMSESGDSDMRHPHTELLICCHELFTTPIVFVYCCSKSGERVEYSNAR